jgi:predicted RNA methylase
MASITKKLSNLTMEKQTTGLKRNTIDKYYTTEDAVKKCITIIQEKLTIDKDDLCIEPSAGNGAFIDHIKKLSNHHMFYDIAPDHKEIVTQDYLELEHLELAKKYSDNKIHVIGNPPFGRQSSSAIKFIKKSAKYVDTISFILPKSFKKASLKKHFPLKFHLEIEQDMPDNSFTIDGKKHNVPCVFQIWIKKPTDRPVPKKLVPSKYKFVKNNETPDISFRRVGVYAGKVDKTIDGKSVQSHYFIKFDNDLSDAMFDKLSAIEYDCKNNTVGPKSISKQELIAEFNKLM